MFLKVCSRAFPERLYVFNETSALPRVVCLEQGLHCIPAANSSNWYVFSKYLWDVRMVWSPLISRRSSFAGYDLGVTKRLKILITEKILRKISVA